MAPVAYIAEDGLVGHQREERPLSSVKTRCPSVGECQDREAGVGGLVTKESGDGIRRFWWGNDEKA